MKQPETAQPADLETAEHVDLAKVALTYEGFRQLARNRHLSQEEKIGFPDSYRAGYSGAILNDIVSKLGGLDRPNAWLADIGCGCGSLADALLDTLRQKRVNAVLVDSPEMLDQIPDERCAGKVEGFFPDNADAIKAAAPDGGYDYLLCYSVLHYIYVETNLFGFVDHVIDLLKPGGLALIGDIPNVSKRKRFFSSGEGIKFHQDFMKTTDKPAVKFLNVEHDLIDDSVLSGMVQRAHAAGCDAYVLPQPPGLPMANRRDDLLIRKY